MKNLISIIIPVYNSINYIDRCLKCLDEQTSNKFEAIFIDDCSTDNSYEELSKKLKDVKYCYQLLQNEKNMGPGFTRNRGIEESKYDYITFIDSDDYVSEKFVESLENVILSDEPDSILFDYYMVNNESKIHRLAINSDKQILDKEYTLAMCNGMCWGKLFKKDIIIKNNIQFPNIMRSEDLAFVKVYIDKCEKIYYLKEPLYYYINNVKSIMHNPNTLNVNNNIIAFDYINKNIKSSDSLEMIFLREYLYLIVQIMILKKYKTKDIKQFIKDSEIRYKQCYKNIYIKYEPFYFKIILKFIEYKLIFPLRLIFLLKRG